MDQPTLNAVARELAESERLREFVAAPAAARISEPLVPLFLAAVFLERGGPLVVVFPDDAEARDAAEAGRKGGQASHGGGSADGQAKVATPKGPDTQGEA